jgi:suppressor for copper-sensitivity B
MKKIILSLFAVLICTSANALAAESPWSSAEQMQAKLLSAHETISSDQTTLNAALQTRLAPGWHSYWRNPGESGLPPKILWESSKNIESIEMLFPAPKRFQELDLTTFGYDGDVTYPLNITLKEAGKAAKLDFTLETMVCKDICLPVTLPLSLEIEAGEGADSKHRSLIDYAHKKIPSSTETPQLKIENVTITKDAVVASIMSKRGFARTDVFTEVGEFALGSDPQIQINENDKQRANIIVPITQDIQAEFETSGAALPYRGHVVRITVTDGRNAVEQLVDLN